MDAATQVSRWQPHVRVCARVRARERVCLCALRQAAGGWLAKEQVHDVSVSVTSRLMRTQHALALQEVDPSSSSSSSMLFKYMHTTSMLRPMQAILSSEGSQQGRQASSSSCCLSGALHAHPSRPTLARPLLPPGPPTTNTHRPAQAKSPALKALMQLMQSRATKLLAHLDGGRSWGPPGKMPAGGQYCFEHPQVAR